MTDEALWRDDGIGINTAPDGPIVDPVEELFVNPAGTAWEALGYTEEELIAIAVSNAGQYKDGLRTGGPGCGCTSGCTTNSCSCKKGKNGNAGNLCTMACKCTGCRNSGVKAPPAGFIRQPVQPVQPDQSNEDDNENEAEKRRTATLIGSRKRRKSSQMHTREGRCKNCKMCDEGHCSCFQAGYQCGPKCGCKWQICQNRKILMTGRPNPRKKQEEWVSPQQTSSSPSDPTPASTSFEF